MKQTTRKTGPWQKLLCGVFFVAAGCGKPGGQTALPTPGPSTSPAATPTPLAAPVSAVARDVDVSLLDRTGKTVARIKAASGGLNPTKPEEFGTLGAGVATLYRDGKPSARITARAFRADRNTRTIIATGKAVAISLSDPRAPVVRADTMTWNHDQNQITGRGNVLATMKPDWKLPGDFFTADTFLGKVNVQLNKTPGSGTL